eukprot:SAG11_NODE_3033_length_2749_cov_4.883774_3_plen_126_part_00
MRPFVTWASALLVHASVWLEPASGSCAMQGSSCICTDTEGTEWDVTGVTADAEGAETDIVAVGACSGTCASVCAAAMCLRSFLALILRLHVQIATVRAFSTVSGSARTPHRSARATRDTAAQLQR